MNLEIVQQSAAQLDYRFDTKQDGAGRFSAQWSAVRRGLLAIVRVHSWEAVVKQEPTTDERARMNWWNSLSEPERSQALMAAGWKAGATWTPSAADAWAYH
jgi:hypothetical protein